MSTTVVGRHERPESEVFTDSPHSLLRKSIQREHGFVPMRVEGTLPPSLQGTLFRNGPGLYELFDKPYEHMFEGDGAVSGVRLEGGKAWGAVKVVESKGLVEERRQGKPLYGFNAPWIRRFFGMHKHGIKNTANTSVIAWQNRLFALMEASMPTELSMDDLSTIGETDLGIVQQSFSAHPHDVPGRKAMYNFGMRYGKNSSIDLYELPYVGNARHVGNIPLPYPVMLHDFMVTEKHFVFFVSPVKINVMRMLLSWGPFDKMFNWHPEEGTRVIVAPIDDPSSFTQFQTDAFYQWHFANAVEVEGGLLHVDYAQYDDFGSLDQLRAEGDGDTKPPEADSRFVRAIIDPKAKTIQREVLLDKGCEFPRLHPDKYARPYKYVWLTSLGGKKVEYGSDSIMCLDVTTGKAREFTFGEGQTTSEPVFVPREGSTDGQDGHVLSYIFDPTSRSSYMAIFDGQRLEDGPVAKVWFEQHIPTTFHGNWVPAQR